MSKGLEGEVGDYELIEANQIQGQKTEVKESQNRPLRGMLKRCLIGGTKRGSEPGQEPCPLPQPQGEEQAYRYEGREEVAALMLDKFEVIPGVRDSHQEEDQKRDG